MNYIPILSALIPALVLLGYIYWQDRKSPEPIKQLLKATAWGVLSIPLTFCILTPLSEMGLIAEDATTLGEAINIAFLGAAIPEELAKLLVLWLFLRKNTYFDQRMDGIVYAVCVSLGFAGLENILYVVGDEEWMSVALARAFTAVPGHFCYGVVMGYFYSLAKFASSKNKYYSAMALVAPIVLHGIYDAIAFSMGLQMPDWLSGVMVVVFGVFIFYLWKWAAVSIKKHID